MTRRFAVGVIGVGLAGFICSRRRTAGTVKVGFRYIRYTEPEGYFELAWEPIRDADPIAYVPSPRRWREEMPEWAAERRDEIFPEIQEQTRYMEFVWQEYD